MLLAWELSQVPDYDNKSVTQSFKLFSYLFELLIKVVHFKNMIYQPLSEKIQSEPRGKQAVTKHEVAYASLDPVLLLS